MTASIMLYSLVIAMLLSASALVSERILLELGRPCRFVWLASLMLSLAIPAYAILAGRTAGQLEIEQLSPIAAEVSSVGQGVSINSVAASVREFERPLFAWPDWHRSSSALAVLWAVTSIIILALYSISWLRLQRKLARSQLHSLGSEQARVLDDYGPAIFGFFRPQIILPNWFLEANPRFQAIVLNHEHEHIKARDQLTLLGAIILVAAMPWNLALWWQLRRLRSAIEIDCDQRVLRSTVNETEYAEALLEVNRRSSRTPIGAIALTEPVTELERRIRIMLNQAHEKRKAIVGVGTLVAIALLIAACSVHAPEIGTLIKPIPGPSAAALEGLAIINGAIWQRHERDLTNNPLPHAHIELVFDESGGVRSSTFEPTEERPALLGYSEDGPDIHFIVCPETFGGPEPCPDVPVAERRRLVSVSIFDPHKTLPADDHSATDEINRRIAERYFASVFSSPPPANLMHWVLLDNTGEVLAVGQQMIDAPEIGQVNHHDEIDKVFSQRYPDAEITRVEILSIKDSQSRTVRDQAGAPVHLFSGWLSADSPAP